MSHAVKIYNTCIGCTQCVRACPTDVLEMSQSNVPIESLGKFHFEDADTRQGRRRIWNGFVAATSSATVSDFCRNFVSSPSSKLVSSLGEPHRPSGEWNRHILRIQWKQQNTTNEIAENFPSPSPAPSASWRWSVRKFRFSVSPAYIPASWRSRTRI